MTHIVAAGSWIGVDVVVAVLVLTGWSSPDAGLRGLAYRALANFIVAPMLVSAAVCLLTGLMLGLGTKWGLVRYWWVLVKLVLNTALCIAIVFVLAPGMPEIDRYGATGGAAGSARTETLFFPPAVSLTALTFAVVLASAKPWGPIRRKASA
ncbi:hypothetical protein JRG78_03020 [Microbacterium sp. EF45047]|nr:hypothetical protein JSY13_02995 [Microbacterium neungamense]WCM56773.1 hypothetical protein JRG78_03020 [Microbacterium sp. EF45047]